MLSNEIFKENKKVKNIIKSVSLTVPNKADDFLSAKESFVLRSRGGFVNVVIAKAALRKNGGLK